MNYITENVAIYKGDTVEVTKQMPNNVFDFSIYSPPFSNLYTYSDSIYDMGNTDNDDEFFKQYCFLLKEKYRTHKNNTVSCVHCKDLPLYKGRDGASGLSDFTGRIIKEHEKVGFTYQGKFRIWKDPVIEMQRTKNHGLLHKNYTKRSEAVRQGMSDYVLIFKKIEDVSDSMVSYRNPIYGKETVLRCCELWSNKIDNIVSIFHSDLDDFEYIDYGFFEYMKFTFNIKEISNKLKNGRNVTVALTEKDISKDGIVIGKKDISIDLIEDMKKYNLVFHSRCYLTNGTELITFRKWAGEFEDSQVVRDLATQKYVGRDEPIKLSNEDRDLVGYSIHCWQRYASPVWNDLDDLPLKDEFSWFDISQTNCLNIKQARDNKDEKHICPLQLDLIEKCVKLFTKENDICASFFGGIGSEPYTFRKLNRKAYAAELKDSYFNVMVNNIKTIEEKPKGLFD
jgi:DNA modification methylase